MTTRFTIILLVVTAILLAWTYIHYQYEDSRQFRLQQLSDLQIFVYMNDEVRLGKLSGELKSQVPEIDSLQLESGKSIAQTIVKEYNLDIVPTDRDSLPAVLTLTFVPETSSFAARDKVQKILKQAQVPEADVELQTPAWGLVQKELNYLKARWANTTVFSAILIFVLFVFARLYLLLCLQRKVSGNRETILESIRHSETKHWHTALLVAVPLLASVLAYHLLALLNVLKPFVEWPFFAIQACTLLAATAVALSLDAMGANDTGGQSPMITVTVPPQSDALDS